MRQVNRLTLRNHMSGWDIDRANVTPSCNAELPGKLTKLRTGNLQSKIGNGMVPPQGFEPRTNRL
jgi:hypothetical protein